jgi:hypothetical protein
LKRSKKLVAIDEGVAEAIAAAARRIGLTVSELVELVLLQALRLNGLAEAIGATTIALDMARLGLVPVPLQALKQLEESTILERGVARSTELLVASLRARGYECLEATRISIATILPGARIVARSAQGRPRLVITVDSKTAYRLLLSALKAATSICNLELVELNDKQLAVTVAAK